MSTVATLILLQQYLTRYVLSTILVLGNLGNVIAIGIFLQKKHRTNSCSIYLAAISVFGLISANWAIAPLVYALDHFNMVNSSLVLCRIRGYIIQFNSMCFRYTLILMCADRYALCNSRVSIRALCRPQIAYRSICILIIFWMIVASQLLIWENIENNQCSVYGIYGQVFSFYSLIFTGTIPIVAMTSISILTRNALREMRFRVRPFDDTRGLNRRDIKLMKLVIVQVIVYILCTFTHPLTLIYTQITNSTVLNKSAERKQIESFIDFITMSLLLYLNYNTTFYVHILASKAYRMEVKQLILKLIEKLRGIEQNQRVVQRTVNQIRTRQQIQLTSRV
jgi:hypothetical protein